MKFSSTKFGLLLSSLLLSASMFAQAPNAIPYQGVARNSVGEIIASQAISLRLSIHNATAGGTVVFQETHHPTTTTLGLFSLSIGGGTPIVGTFAGVNWGTGAKFIQVEMDATGGSTYVDMGTTQLNSVPYALYAQTAGNASTLADGTAVGNTAYWNGTGWVASSANIYNNGGNVGIGTVTPANKLDVVGSIGIDGGKLPFYNTGESVFIGQLAGQNDDLNYRQNVYIGQEAGKSNVTGNLNTYLGNGVATQSTGEWNTALGQGAMNGIVEGSQNTVVGRGALSSASSGYNNAVLGTSALGFKVSGDGNVAIGQSAGINNLTGSGNIFLGTSAGADETGSNKLYIENGGSTSPLIYGDFATDLLRVNGTLQVGTAYTFPSVAGLNGYVMQTDGAGNITWVDPSSFGGGGSYVDLTADQSIAGNKTFSGSTTLSQDANINGMTVGHGSGSKPSNTVVGASALAANTTGGVNTAIGSSALFSNTEGSYNTAIGLAALYGTTTGLWNIGIGPFALQSNTTGNNNMAFGYFADVASPNLSNAIALGGGSSVSTSNTIQLGNSSMASVKTSAVVTANGFVKTGGTSTQALMADGSVADIPSVSDLMDLSTDQTVDGNKSFTNNITAAGFAIPGGTNTQALMADGSVAAFPALSGFMDLSTNQNAAGNKSFYGTVLFNNDVKVHSLTIGRGGGFGGSNTALGEGSLAINTTSSNTAVGYNTLKLTTTGNVNTALGSNAMPVNSTGARNTGIGGYSLYSSTTGDNNTAVGASSLFSNTSGVANTALGNSTLSSNNDGSYNVSVGYGSLQYNAHGLYNVAVGANSLLQTTTDGNVAVGYYSGYGNSTGSYNTSVGDRALYNQNGSYNTGIGANTDMAGIITNATAIGNGAIANADNKIRLGNSSVTVIEGQVAYTFPSDGRFKTNLNESDVKGLDFIMKLKPVVYNFDTRKFEEFLTNGMDAASKKKHFDGVDFSRSTSVRQSGFVAQDVEKAMKASGYNFNGVNIPKNDKDNYSVAYELFVVPLVKGMQEQQAQIADLKKQNDHLAAQNAAFKADLEKIKEKLGIGVVAGNK